MPPAAPPVNDEELSQYLVPSAYVDFEHPAVASVVARLSTDDSPSTAVRIHNFVRDDVRFGWTWRFYAMRASEVLDAGVGYCNTKATLFIALLRGAGIPARQRFVTINAALLKPFLSLPQPVVDHSYTEVHLNGAWHAVDSYVPDRALYAKARERLGREGLTMGYGVHADGVNEWSGDGDAFAQFVRSDASIGAADYGLFADTAAFYAAGGRAEALSGLYRLFIPLGIRAADRAVVKFTEAP